jgi:hypothetical protein
LGSQGTQGVQGVAGPVAGSANQIVYKDASNNPTGSGNLTFDGTNLYVGGNVTIGGTSFIVAANTLTVKDKDIVVGLATTAGGVDISNDTTANHGGIAVASTEGSPLININAGVGTDDIPSTYKQIMWIKSGTFTGLNTDAWIFNYGVGIGSTQIPNGVRLAAGGMQVTDSTLSVPQLNISGVSTFSGTLELSGGLKDKFNTVGVAGSILISTGSGVSWTTSYAAGLQGTQGLQGTLGSQGSQGLQGTIGSQGLQGTQGLQGLSNQGAQGLQGLSNQGTQGLQGIAGSAGTGGGGEASIDLLEVMLFA